MTVDEMKERKKALGYSNKELAEQSGVPLGTIQKVFGGATSAPRRSTIEALGRALGEPSVAAESPVSYGKQFRSERKRGGFTAADYFSLPENIRAELIDGTFYLMAAPTSTHQILVVRLWQKLQEYIDRNHGRCMCLVAPLAVQLDRDDKTMLEPDVLIVCDREKIKNFGCYGAPDFVAEILSPSTKLKDMVIKLSKYWKAGVREVWLIDPENQQITAYHDLQKELVPAQYTFQDRIPVGIWEKKTEVDFAEICEQIKDLLEQED